ncbi:MULTISPECIES: ABC transporter permease [unclassified Cryobacterium]|uniref:ABC transporter permease n=1 Tax=unclassified Cryobacterium TaxID=2649013 RepID=UPI002AB48BCC|nr:MULTISPECIES: ABC transporter permease [unclassified Cryobacterium]MDY7526587.1 ABC transporter permease [Cryobacterium sp. 10C2]MDY7557606.1 ABC transporter permease [Cryobacterium sp. 10C3]MEB0290553.1 ABC transporter permease [Cryobacterium sp. 10C2]
MTTLEKAPVSAGFQDRAGTRKVTNTVRNWALPILIVLVFVIASVTVPEFFKFETIRAILLAASITGIIAVGMTAVTLSGNLFSLGVTASTVFSGVIYVWVGQATGSMFVAAIVAVVSAVAIGVLQGFIVGLGLNTVIVTLAAGSIIYGVTAILTKGEVVQAEGVSLEGFATFQVLGIPLPVCIFILFTALAWFLTEHTLIGRNVHLLGANKNAARNSGISPMGTTVWAFVAFSLGIGIAAVLQASQMHQIQADNLPGLTMDVVAAVLVGGTAVAGGDGSPVKSAIGALFIATITQVMVLLSIPQGPRYFVLGLVVLALVVVLHLLRKAGTR